MYVYEFAFLEQRSLGMRLVTSNEPMKITEIGKRLQRMSSQFFVVLLPLLNANREPKNGKGVETSLQKLAREYTGYLSLLGLTLNIIYEEVYLLMNSPLDSMRQFHSLMSLYCIHNGNVCVVLTIMESMML